MSRGYDLLLELSRRVATPEGAKLYGRPIGSVIGEDAKRTPGSAPAQGNVTAETSSMPKDAPGRTTGGPIPVGNASDGPSKRPVTIERLRSLQAQVRAAQRTDNEAGVKLAQKAFTAAFTEFSKDRDPAEVLGLLGGKK